MRSPKELVSSIVTLFLSTVSSISGNIPKLDNYTYLQISPIECHVSGATKTTVLQTVEGG